MLYESIYAEGAEDYCNGLTPMHCPYLEGTEAYHQWLLGFEYAREFGAMLRATSPQPKI